MDSATEQTPTKKSPRISLIVKIPEDKEADLLPCLKSLNNQILDDLEILCAVTVSEPDYSEDNSPALADLKQLEIIKDYAKRDHRFNVLLVKSHDYGKIMNFCIDKAKGEYISFISANDFLNPEMSIELFALAKKHDADIIRGNFYEHYENHDDFHESILPEEAGYIIEPTEDTRIFYQPPVLGSGLYRREFLIQNKLFFLEDLDSLPQDASYNFMILASGGKIVLTNKSYLHQRQLGTDSPYQTKAESLHINNEYARIEKLLKNRGDWKTYGYIFQAVKFASYNWNMLHLPDKELEPYLLRMRAEFHDADNQKMLVKNYFPKNHWKALQAILKYPPQIFLAAFKSYRKKKNHK
ncbi:glycosyltransferase family 2 protein [Candidatus Saccharibacteria bacterium]|nr:glycosyltransferase family 2 protein [Candidatus Saccharibacteria bacterium]